MGVFEPSWVDFNCAAGRVLLEILGAFAGVDEVHVCRFEWLVGGSIGYEHRW